MKKDYTKHSYVYKVTDKTSGKFYIGYRTCLKTTNPNDDLGIVYFTSGSIKNQYKEFTSFYTKEIISIHDVKHDAYIEEQTLISLNIKDPLCLNKNYNPNASLSLPDQKNKQFNQVYLNSSYKKRKEIRRQENKDKKIQKKQRAHDKLKKSCIQYCDLETKAIVYIFP